MKRLVIIIIAALLLSSCREQDKPALIRDSADYFPAEPVSRENEKPEPVQIYEPLNYDTMKAVWITYFELADILKDSTAESFERDFSLMCRNIRSLGANTVFVHVRAFSDSCYSSELYPESVAFSGCEFDALEIMTRAAHSYGLSFHAWINPLRCATKKEAYIYYGTVIGDWIDGPENYDEYICWLEEDGHYWLNPAVPEVRELIAKGAAEIVSGYDVDGIHIDDYFYPTDEPFFDAGRYVESGTAVPLDEWRRSNCSEMVSEIYAAIKSENKDVLFGISPQGNISNNYSYLCADVKRWSREEGFCDYIAPQLYYGYENEKKPFSEALSEWAELCEGSSVRLVIGTAAYKLDSESEYEENTGVIGRQLTDSLAAADGAALYSYSSLFPGSERTEEELEYIRRALYEK